MTIVICDECNENLLRGQTLNALNASKTHCKRGHEFNEANTRVFFRASGAGPYRACRVCARDYSRQRVRERYVPKARTRPTHCKRGHPFDDVNTVYSKDGFRECRECRTARYARSNAKRAS